jgi:hypothetical protein
VHAFRVHNQRDLTGYEVIGLWWRIKTTTALAACAAKAVVEKEKA